MPKRLLNRDEGLLLRIVNHNLQYEPCNSDLGLFKGRMGTILFFFHYARYTGKTLYADFAEKLLDDIYEDITEEVTTCQLCEIGWGILYLLQQGFVEGDADEILKVIDHRIHLQHSRHTGMTEDYLSFRFALANKKLNGYSSSGLLRKLISSGDMEELSWRNGLKIIWG